MKFTSHHTVKNATAKLANVENVACATNDFSDRTTKMVVSSTC